MWMWTMSDDIKVDMRSWSEYEKSMRAACCLLPTPAAAAAAVAFK